MYIHHCPILNYWVFYWLWLRIAYTNQGLINFLSLTLQIRFIASYFAYMLDKDWKQLLESESSKWKWRVQLYVKCINISAFSFYYCDEDSSNDKAIVVSYKKAYNFFFLRKSTALPLNLRTEYHFNFAYATNSNEIRSTFRFFF